jgi:hypothetical protein
MHNNDLHIIPVSRPEELLHVSVVDRMNQMERHMAQMHEMINDLREKNGALHDKFQDGDLINTELSQRTDNRLNQLERHVLQRIDDIERIATPVENRRDSISDGRAESRKKAPESACAQKRNQPLTDHSTEEAAKPQYAEALIKNMKPKETTMSRPNSLTTQKGRNDSSQTILKCATSSSEASKAAEDDGFQFPKNRRHRRPTRCTGSLPDEQSGCLRGAPPSQFELFIYRVVKPVTCEDLMQYLSRLKIQPKIYEIEMVSHEEAHFASFRVACDVASYKQLLNGNQWPGGVCVEKYWRRQNSSALNNGK